MAKNVKSERTGGTRAYDATGRRERAQESRRAIVDAARELLEARGYAATTIAEVAKRAGVSAESIYKGFGTKAALMKDVFDVAIAGDDESTAVADRPHAQRIREEPDIRVKLGLYAEDVALRAERSARVQLALRNGAALDPAIGALWQDIQAERLTGMTMVARHLVDTGQVRADTGIEEVRDVLWTCISIEVYDLLVLQRGWTRGRYADWLARTLIGSMTEG